MCFDLQDALPPGEQRRHGSTNLGMVPGRKDLVPLCLAGTGANRKYQLAFSQLDGGRGLSLDDFEQVPAAPDEVALAIHVLAAGLAGLGLQLGDLAAQPRLAVPLSTGARA